MSNFSVFTLLSRELNAFFNNLIGIMVVIVFLLITALFLWVFPGDYNILDAGHANLNGLFSLAPMVFLFIVPAITMRFFAEEIKSGTIEVLFTRPVTDIQVIMAKWLAGVILVLLTLLPTWVYYATVSWLALPPGIDSGGTLGSYLGLFFLGASFVSIGLFSSSLTGNQVVSFIVALFISGFMLFGFELIYTFSLFGRADLFIRNLGIQSHYLSMSRGVIDTRDVLYFASLNALFIVIAKIKLESRKWISQTHVADKAHAVKTNLRRRHLIQLAAGLLIIISVNQIGSAWFFRIDLTAEKRHSLTRATRDMLKDLDDIVYFRIYLDGDFPAEFKRLQNQTREVLDEFRAFSDLVHYEFIDPTMAGDRKQVESLYDFLVDMGIRPTQIQIRADDATSQQIIFPGAIASYRGKEVSVQLLQDQMGLPAELVINNSAQLLEYSLVSAIYQLVSDASKTVGFLTGIGEPAPEYLSDITHAVEAYYDVAYIDVNELLEGLQHISTLVVTRPTKAFSESEKFLIDQYVMQGGAVLWLMDPVLASMDSLQLPPHESIGLTLPVNLDDVFFGYGVRLNANLLQDLQCAPIAVTTGYMGDRPQINLLPWPFFPMVGPATKHPVVANLNLVRTEFVSSLDTIEVAGIEKTVLLQTSPYTRIMPVPVHIALGMLQNPIDELLFRSPPQAVAILLEGNFQSLFANRIAPVDLPGSDVFREKSVFTSMIVVGDADIIMNQVNAAGQPLALGYDRYTGETYGNKDFVLNAINYLTDDSGIIEARAKEIRLRLLDKTLVASNKTGLQMINVLLPILLVLIFGVSRMVVRKKYYTRST
jgi:ABC-2 type transport system permease protein